MNDSQSTICQIILSMLQQVYFRNNLTNNESFKYIFNQTIRQYAEVNHNNTKTYNKIELLITHHEFSERAYNLLCQELECEENINRENLIEMTNEEHVRLNNTIWNTLHREHIVPVSVLINNLLGIEELTLDAVKNIMQENKVIVLTKEESNVLDGSPNREYLLDGEYVNGMGMRNNGTRQERLDAIGAEIHENTINNTLG